MARYIDADALKNDGHLCWNDGEGNTYYEIDHAPTADVVEVVRCKDCKLSTEPKSVSRYDLYCNNYDVRFCEKEQKIVCGTHFCSYGTPKERGGEK